jgi:hypothetical protein
MGAGVYRIDARQGAMHGGQFVFPELLYGCNDESVFLRLDFPPEEEPCRLRLNLKGGVTEDIQFGPTGVKVMTEGSQVVAAYDKILEIKAPRVPGEPVLLQLSLWQESLPLDSMPREGWLELRIPDQGGWTG